MSDVDQKTAGTPFASGAAWSESEKIAYLLVLCENEGKIDAKISKAPMPAGRTVVSCKMLLVRLKKKYGKDIEKIKSGQTLGGGAGDDGDAVAGAGNKSAGNRKRKSKVAKGETDMDSDDAAEGSPKKKPTPRKKKVDAAEEEAFGDEEV
ncbi:hypothetical protein PtrSN002B_003712 [Pyrenophora tritici-repentis]|uniref:Uncharacterized protein n=2 Tax=Pyrenophora tritici-repentis TaxID=45151 RepID=A0A2W1HDG0_9PLEO|nr:uncharacterized protein PTRG_11644 [Pyrenophora tritici-repentis Pt-1C-BFP]KAA8627153.1 hypothetical protein PtrV1_02833 [Pyrenophora tritici-repentis]EDU44694.1 predicted protein [Pyrenophora tritici-repentis Pt-1C-BFP]KAF7455589.1 hypothetical protein A1F99_028470 [Pyrenophora tritici-repentis]KAF7578790.1 hypothetical protein PtrM4_030300 [Pyrenophora tritici-repentis]KAG9389339.1 hypothetical protein A1F94_002232 [Pyrenophora tritici-repentis]